MAITATKIRAATSAARSRAVRSLATIDSDQRHRDGRGKRVDETGRQQVTCSPYPQKLGNDIDATSTQVRELPSYIATTDFPGRGSELGDSVRLFGQRIATRRSRRASPAGQGRLFFPADERHIHRRAPAIDVAAEGMAPQTDAEHDDEGCTTKDPLPDAGKHEECQAEKHGRDSNGQEHPPEEHPELQPERLGFPHIRYFLHNSY